MSSTPARLGLDLGSVAVHAALVLPNGRLLGGRSRATAGRPLAALEALLAEIEADWGALTVPTGVTGSAAGLLAARSPEAAKVNDVVATARGAAALCPEAASVIEVGGHLSRWMSVEPGGSGELLDFSLSELCAAGAGVFLEQQAGRLKLTVQQLARLAAEAERGATVAGRCTVFAKSDMIHLQQKGTPTAEIAYGVCLALARNFQASIMRGRESCPSVVLVGGGALNPGLVRAFREVLELEGDALRVVDDGRLAGALGAALLAEQDRAVSTSALRQALAGERSAPRELVRLPALPDPGCPEPGLEQCQGSAGDRPFVLGVDVGSVSTNLVLVSPEGELFDALYLATRGAPLEVLEEGLSTLEERHGKALNIVGVATTGSGRHLAAEFLRADLVRNEITAQLRGAFQALPGVDTVLEIGGQDSKFISARDGHIQDFTMNKVCAAGTGSFLEEQAERMSLNIIGEFAERTLAAESPLDLGSRCTVFMDSELVHAMRQGASTEDLAAGLALSVARNYIEKVVAGRPIGEKVLFQGGTASNRAVVAAFRQLLGRPVTVHPHNRVSGAVGVAQLLLDAREAGELPATTRFEGVKACQGEVERSFECRACSNRCQVTRFRAGDRVRFFGDICERYSERDDSRTGVSRSEHLLAQRWRGLLAAAGLEEGWQPPRDPDKALGIPRASVGLQFLPIWTAIARAAGREPVLSPPSSSAILADGQRRLQADTCLPVKVSYGHVLALQEHGVQDILMPAVNSVPARQRDERGPFVCAFTRHLPYMLRAALDANLLSPEVEMDMGPGKEILEPQALAAALGITEARLVEAVGEGRAAMTEWARDLQEMGRELLEGEHQRILVIMGKPYNLADPYLNMDLGRQLSRLGLAVLPMDCLPLDSVHLPPRYDELVWQGNRDYVRAAQLIRLDPRLFPVVLSSFGCGPDGFANKHLDDLLDGRPRLFLELDEHRAEAGFVTRLEAFSDEIDAHVRRRAQGQGAPTVDGEADSSGQPRGRIFVPWFADHAWAHLGAMRRAGFDAHLLPQPDEETRRLGEELGSGRECHPFTLLAGDLVRMVRDHDYQPGDSYMFQGGVNACLFSQYADGLRHVKRRLGADVRVDSPTPEELQGAIGVTGGIALYRGMMAVEILMRQACRCRPYEQEPGAVDTLYRRLLEELSQAVEHFEVMDFLPGALDRLRAVPLRDEPRRPLVGVAGDIYTRVNGFANGDLFHRLEALGCEAWPAPFSVDLFTYNNPRFIREAARRWELKNMFQRAFLGAVREMEEWWQGLHWPLDERFVEPTPKQVREMAGPYVGTEAESLVILNVAKMVDFAQRGADGVLNAICFGCMVGGISAALVQRIRDDHGGIPMATIAYGGTGGSDGSARLEAFAHQVKRFRERREQA